MRNSFDLYWEQQSILDILVNIAGTGSFKLYKQNLSTSLFDRLAKETAFVTMTETTDSYFYQITPLGLDVVRIYLRKGKV